MDALLTALVMVAGGYVVPVLMPNGRWLAGLAALGALAALALWFGWVEQQTDSLAAGVAALLVLWVAAAFALGVLVRALVLWRGWTGGRAALATGLGAVIWCVGVFWFLWGG